jgi:hypothetical protein
MNNDQSIVNRVSKFSSSLMKQPLTMKQKKYIQQLVIMYDDRLTTDSETVMRLALDATESFTIKPTRSLHFEEPDQFDLHSMMNEIINKPVGNNDVIRIKQINEIKQEVLWGKDQYNLAGGFGKNDLLALTRAINPESTYKKAYLTLDSNAAEFLENNTKMRWDYLPVLAETSTSTNSRNNIKNITEIRIYSMVVNKFNSPMQRATILIDEFSSQSFIAQNGRRFHTIGLLNDLEMPAEIRTRSTVHLATGWAPDATIYDKYELLSGFRFNEGVYKFAKPITTFDSITLSVGDPFDKIAFRKHNINNCELSSMNYTAVAPFGSMVIDCKEDHYITIGDQIYTLKISGFTTDQPIVDAILIEYVNTMEFTTGTATTAQIITMIPQQVRPPGGSPITVQFSNLAFPNTFVGNPSQFTITFDGYRIITNIEFTYIDDEEE